MGGTSVPMLLFQIAAN
ncbi:DUF6053 domain-containing protein [Lysobacter enzymogenes]